MLFVITACIIQTLFVVWLSPSASELLATTTGISWRWLDAPLVDVGLPKPNTMLTEIGDTFFQALATPADSSALQVVEVVTVLTADSPANELSDMDVRADDTPPQGIIWQLLEPAVAVVEVTLSAMPSVDDAVSLVSVHPQPTQFPASVTRVRSHVSSSLLSSPIAPVSLFAIAILLIWGGQVSEVVVEEVPVPEKAEHSKPLEAMDSMASIPCGSVSSSDAVQPLRTSIGVQFTSDVCEIKRLTLGILKDISVDTEPVSKTSDISIGTSQPVSKISVGIQCSVATDEQVDEFTPGESQASLFMTTAEGTLPLQTTDGPDVFTVPTVPSLNNIYILGATMLFPSVDDLANIKHGTDPSSDGAWSISLDHTLGSSFTKTSSGKAIGIFSCLLGGGDTKHVWAREFWHRALRSEELIKILYEEVFPVDNAATDKDKYDMELGEGLVRISALRLSKHATNPILLLPYNVLPEDADPKDLLFMSVEATEAMVSSSDSVGSRSPSPFVHPSNPQSRLLELSSSEASVAAPTPRNGLPALSSIPTACRSRPALAEVTNTPRFVETTPSRAWTPMNAV
ncbi:hypothetical protein IW261DRAFT_1598939 [Armillaria novae-zelandiae]|uniref:Uncharacterized protein n=1 Tax=Armillaria novae-zelandiae TaxID=153914 RepID=A0AA39ND01_9AGAR|nr:hypothetical protein IW261DRAFT_1598939 [Armillaria novae-zelandiae]